jgi:hypothetical protein
MMPDLSALSADELKAELARREEAAKPKPPEPKSYEEINWHVVYQTVVDGQADTVKNSWKDSDLDAYISEAAFEAVFGKEYWTWRRAQTF